MTGDITKPQQAALKWLRDHGGSAAFAKTKKGGHIYLAMDETGPFTSSTIKKLEDLGLVEKRAGRIWVLAA